MTQSKVLKLAKKLQQFNIQELEILLEEDSSKIHMIINDLLKSGVIKQIDSDNYIFISNSRNQIKKLKTNSSHFTDDDLYKLEEERITLTEYINAPGQVKFKIDKYMLLLNKARDIKSSKLKEYITNVWNIEHPEMKSSLTAFRRNKKKLKEMGIKGLIPANVTVAKASSFVSDNIYKNFREYLSKNEHKTLKRNFFDFKKIFLETNSDIEEWQFPSYSAMTIKINKEETSSKPVKLMTNNIFISRINVETDKRYEFETFKEVAIDYIKTITTETKLSKPTIKAHKGHLRQHLIPFFEDVKLSDIDMDLIEKYKKLKVDSKVLAPSGLRKQLILLKNILRIYSASNNFSFSTTKTDIKNDFLKK